MSSRQEDTGENGSTRYEVAKLRRAVCGKEERMEERCVCYGKVGQSGRERRGRWEAKRKYEVKEIGATGLRIGISVAAIFKNFLGTGVLSRHPRPNKIRCSVQGDDFVAGKHRVIKHDARKAGNGWVR